MKPAALSLVTVLLTAPLFAETTPAPPDWQDGHGASVYTAANQQAPAGSATNEPPRYAVHSQQAEVDVPLTAAPVPAASPKFDSAVAPAVHETPITSIEPSTRRLAPPTSRSEAPASQSAGATAGPHRAINFGIPVQSMYTVVTALVVVIGAFLLFAWALRRGGKNASGRRGTLPADAVSVLGRVPIAARQFAELLRVGNKLVLVAITPNGPTPLTEVTDPVEVDRLVGLCQQFDPKSSTKAFEQVFQQLAGEPTASGFLGGEPLPQSLSSAASAYRSHRGAGTRV